MANLKYFTENCSFYIDYNCKQFEILVLYKFVDGIYWKCVSLWICVYNWFVLHSGNFGM